MSLACEALKEAAAIALGLDYLRCHLPTALIFDNDYVNNAVEAEEHKVGKGIRIL